MKMLKFGVLIFLPCVLGGIPANNHGYGSSRNNRMAIINNGPRTNMPNNNQPGPNIINQPGPNINQPGPNINQPGPNIGIPFPFPPEVPYQCTMRYDRGYFCPYRYERPSTRYYFNVYSGRCESFYFLGCGGNLNNYGSRAECLRSCACFARPDYGSYPCSEPQNYRWYFNKYSGTCQSFIQSGCNGGSDNSFRSQLECQSTCGPEQCFGPYCDDGPINYNIMVPSRIDRANAAGNNRAQSPGVNSVGSSGQAAHRPPMPNNRNTPINRVAPMPMPNSPNMPGNVAINMPVGMPNTPNAPMPEPQHQATNGMNTHGVMGNTGNSGNSNSGNNGVNMNSIAQIWKMASNAMNADSPPNGVNMLYQSQPNQMKSVMTMY